MLLVVCYCVLCVVVCRCLMCGVLVLLHFGVISRCVLLFGSVC